MLSGRDFSANQDRLPDLTGLDFAIVRAGIGFATDTRYAEYSGNVRDAGLTLGAYWFWIDGQPDEAADLFVETTRDAAFLALDLEGPGSGSQDGKAQARAFIRRVHELGRTIGLYHSLSGFPELGQDFDWIAFWASVEPPVPWAFWQYKHDAPDLFDRFNGSLADLVALTEAPVPLSVKSEDLVEITIPSGTTVYTLAGEAGREVGREHVRLALQVVTTVGTDFYVARLPSTAGPQLQLVRVGDVTAKPVPSGISEAEVAAAHLDGFEDARAQGIAALQALVQT
jgi:hypothetical protein